jgi:GAF domain-containing protein
LLGNPNSQVFYWRGYPIGSGAFVAVPISFPGSKRVVAVLCADTLQRAPVKAVTPVELEALEVVASSLGKALEAAERRERASIAASMRLAADAAARQAKTHGERATKGIIMSCTMQSVEQQLRGQDMSNQLEASVMELVRFRHEVRMSHIRHDFTRTEHLN